VPRLASKERSRQPGPVWKFAVRGGNPCSASIIAIGAVVVLSGGRGCPAAGSLLGDVRARRRLVRGHLDRW